LAQASQTPQCRRSPFELNPQMPTFAESADKSASGPEPENPMPSEGIVEDVFTNGIAQSTTVNDPPMRRSSVEDLIQRASTTTDEDGNTRVRSDKSVIGILADGKNQEEKEKTRWKLRAKLATILGLIGMIMAVGIQFSINYVANEMTKETTSVDFGDGAALVANGGEKIMQVAPATSKLTLAHALVLGMDHLQQLDEVVYRYEDANGKDVRVAAKVLEVQRAQGKNESDVTVTIITHTHNKLVLSPHQSGPMLWLNGESHQICGDVRCANLMINDPGLDLDTLNARLDVIFANSGGDSRRLKWVECYLWGRYKYWAWVDEPVDDEPCPDRRRRARRRRGTEIECAHTEECPQLEYCCETYTENECT